MSTLSSNRSPTTGDASDSARKPKKAPAKAASEPKVIPAFLTDEQAAAVLVEVERSAEPRQLPPPDVMKRLEGDWPALVNLAQEGGDLEPKLAKIRRKDKARAAEILAKITAARSAPAVPTLDGFGGFGGEWGEPKPIRAELSPVPPMIPEMIPAKLRGWLVDIANRMSCSLDFVAAGAIVTLGSVIGRSVLMHPKRKDDWKVTPNLWGGIVAPPGSLKSPALEEVKKPLKRLSIAADKAHALAVEEHNANVLMAKTDAKIATARLEKARKSMSGPSGGAGSMSDEDMHHLAKSIAKSETMVEPSAKRYILQTSSPQAMQKILGENPRGLMRFEDELIKILRFLDDPKQGEAKGMYLTGWNGGVDDDNDTLSRGRVKAMLTLSILGGIQPGPLLPYVRAACSGQEDDGFMQRFQVLVYPDEPGSFVNVDEFPDRDARERAYSVYEFLDRLEAEPELAGAERGTWDDEADPPFLHFDEEAQEVFNAWYEPFINEKVNNPLESTAMRNHLAKFRSLYPTLALIFHLVDVASHESMPGPVTAKATRMAAEWCLYLEAHARRIYQASFDADPEPGKKLLARIQKGSVPSPFTAQWIYKRDWSGLDKDATERAINCLEDRGYIRGEETPEGTNGRPTVRYHIHPEYPRKAEREGGEKE